MDEIFDEQRNIPFYGTERDLETLATLITNCIKVLNEATNVREMVLETWLTVDYAIRQFLLSGFELSRFCDEEFDLQYKLLPREFSNLLGLLEFTVRFNATLPLAPEPPKPNKAGGFHASFEFWRFVKDHSPELFKQIEEIHRKYILTKNPGMTVAVASAGSLLPVQPKPQIARMNIEWRKVACALDEEWFKSAKQLNRARNHAAHSFRPEAVSRELGLTGPEILFLTRNKCLKIIQTILGVKTVMAHE